MRTLDVSILQIATTNFEITQANEITQGIFQKTQRIFQITQGIFQRTKGKFPKTLKTGKSFAGICRKSGQKKSLLYSTVTYYTT